MNIDLDVLERQARAAKADNATCVEAASPAAVLELIATVRELKEQNRMYKKAYGQMRFQWDDLAIKAKRLAMGF